MVPAVFAEILKRTMGLDAVAIGPSAIERAVRERMTACLLPDVRVYEEYVLASASELQQLIEAAVVPETWFFRDPAAFAELARTLVARSPSADGGRVVRLLSVPCSTGEEPYSMAMALLDARLAPYRFRIDAVDISTRALGQARRALYGHNSFRGKDLSFRERYFEQTASGQRLSDAVRELVHFQPGNMLAPEFLPQVEIYDAIFCRNLLVYFDRATQLRAISVLRRLLTPDGVVFVGPAEAGLMFSHDFVWSKVPLAFAFCKGDAPVLDVAPSAQPLRRSGVGPTVARPFVPHPSRVAVLSTSQPVAAAEAAPAPASGIEAAARLADVGRFAEAADLCAQHVRAHGPSARAFQLMGLICNAAGNAGEAVRYFRKALYLDPRDGESLVHLALLLEKRGDLRGARTLQDRLRRLERRETTGVR